MNSEHVEVLRRMRNEWPLATDEGPALDAAIASISAQQPAAVDGADAKDAEIEALRVRADAMAGEAIKHEARAERLAEALREKADKWDRIGDEHGARQFTGNDHKLFANELRALLRDHDQE